MIRYYADDYSSREYLIVLHFLKMMYYFVCYFVSIKILKSIYKEKNHRMKYSCIIEINRSDYNYHARLIIIIGGAIIT